MSDRRIYNENYTNSRVYRRGQRAIKTLLPKDPCNGCNLGVGCCGCPEGYDYAEKVRPYKDANIYDIALGIRKIHDIKQNMKLEEDEIKNLMESIPEELFVNCDNEKGIQILAEDAMNISDASSKTGKWKNRERLGDYGNV